MKTRNWVWYLKAYSVVSAVGMIAAYIGAIIGIIGLGNGSIPVTVTGLAIYTIWPLSALVSRKLFAKTRYLPKVPKTVEAVRLHGQC